MTLTEFLLARIAEDEASVITMDCTCGHRDDNTRPLANCPERILAKCEAERRIVEHCSATSQCGGYEPPGSPDRAFYEEMRDKYGGHLPDAYSPGCDGCASASSVTMSDEWILKYLALPYADHPDYDEAWKP